MDEGAGEVLGELANTIAGRMRACLVSRGFDLKMGLPEVRSLAAGEQDTTEFDLEALFRCHSGEMFRVGLRVQQNGHSLGVVGRSPDAAAVAAEPAAGPAAAVPVAVGAEAPEGAAVAATPETGQQSVDDVLF
jgi:hypothetical protein